MKWTRALKYAGTATTRQGSSGAAREHASRSRRENGRADGGHVPVADARELVRKAAVEADAVRMADRQQPPAADAHEGLEAIARTIAQLQRHIPPAPTARRGSEAAQPNSRRKSADRDQSSQAPRQAGPRSPGVTRIPFWPSCTISGMALIRVPMRGNPAAAAS